MNRSDLYAGVLLLLFGIVFLVVIVPNGVSSGRAGDAAERLVGPRFLPVVIGVAIMTLSAVLIASTLIRRRQGKPQTQTDARLDMRLILVLAVFALYMGLLHTLGYLIATAVSLAALFWLFGERKPLAIAVSSIASTLALFLLFGKVLAVSLPRGLLFP